MNWEQLPELSIGLFSTLVAFAIDRWLRGHQGRAWALAGPVAWILCLAIGSAIADEIGENGILVKLTYIAIAIGSIHVALILAPNRRLAWTTVTIIGALCLLTFFQLRQPVANYLDSFTFTIGGFRFTLMKLLEATCLLTVLIWITRALHRWLALRIRTLDRVDPTVKEWLVKLSELGLYFIALLGVFQVVGLDVTTLAVFGGALGVSVGLGLQKIVSNYVSGLILLFEKTVKVGDVIELEGGPSGRIYRLDPRGTFILCTDGKEVIVPNEEFVTKKVTNLTYSDKMGQISIPICISYNSDVEKAQSLMLEAASAHPLCIADPSPACHMTQFGSYGIHFVLQFWIDDVSQGISKPQSDVMFAILHKLREARIEIPILHSPDLTH